MHSRSFFRIAAGILVAGFLNYSVLAQETKRQYLSGLDKDNTVLWEFMCTSGANSGFWTNIPVPSHWDVLGFGTLNYHTDRTNAFGEQGLYAHTFSVPKRWSDQRVFLVFDGSMTDTTAKINGQQVGSMHQGSFYRFKYDVTDLLKFGEKNRLEVTVAKHSANTSVNNAERRADYWVFGGIFRPVFLEAVPRQFIRRVAIDARADGAFAVDVYADGITDADTIEAQVITLDGKKVGAAFSEKLAGDKTTVRAQIQSPRQWTAETPNLYSVEILLKQGSKVVHRIQQRFGFRTMEVRYGDGFYVNGQRIILKGVNRHSFWPDSGRCLNEAIHRMDIETMQAANMNSVRMSHYPPDEKFLDLCDELGLYVLDELGGWQRAYDTPVGTKLVEELIVRDVNHPSILFWDNGNEGGWNTNLVPLYRQLDPQKRHVLHPWAILDGVNTAHYRVYEETKRIAATTNIHMPTEFLHGLYDGGHAAGLQDYWDMMKAGKTFGGGFLWSLADEGVKRPDTGKIDVAGNLGPDGIVGPYRQREGSFYAIKEIWSPIQVTRESDGSFKVQNQYSFTDASQCRFTWELRKFPSPGKTSRPFKMVAKGKAEAPEIAPGNTGVLQLNLPASQKDADALALKVTDPKGRELWTWVFALSSSATAPERTSASSRKIPLASDGEGVVEIKTGDLTVRINKQTGLLAGVQKGTQTYSFNNGPRLPKGQTKLVNLETKTEGNECIVNETFEGGLTSVQWRVNGDGWLRCDYSYTASGTNDYLGVLFDYPETMVKHKRWLGDGPFRVWKNRTRGVTLNVWENDYNNTITGYNQDNLIYPEFKGYFSNVRWLQLETSEGLITTVMNSEIPFTQMFTPEFPPRQIVMRAQAPLTTAGLGFLHGIAPIGNKFRDAFTTGPQGQPYVGEGKYSGSVSFYFGKLP